jgi:hypothetical protein
VFMHNGHFYSMPIYLHVIHPIYVLLNSQPQQTKASPFYATHAMLLKSTSLRWKYATQCFFFLVSIDSVCAIGAVSALCAVGTIGTVCVAVCTIYAI